MNASITAVPLLHYYDVVLTANKPNYESYCPEKAQ
jgi:hypothetical protein